MARTITAANIVLYLTVPGLFPVPQRIQGFATDDVFDVEGQQTTETMMGVDGRLSGGFIFTPIKMSCSLQADSSSMQFFEDWNAAHQSQRETLIANGTILLSAVGRKYDLKRGFLDNYKPLPDAKKVLQPRKFSLTWERVSPANV